MFLKKDFINMIQVITQPIVLTLQHITSLAFCCLDSVADFDHIS